MICSNPSHGHGHAGVGRHAWHAAEPQHPAGYLMHQPQPDCAPPLRPHTPPNALSWQYAHRMTTLAPSCPDLALLLFPRLSLAPRLHAPACLPAGEINFNVVGVLFQSASIVTESFRLCLIQILLQARGIKLNPVTTLYYVAPACFVFLCVPYAFLEMPQMLNPNVEWSLPTGWLMLSATCAFGGCMHRATGRTTVPHMCDCLDTRTTPTLRERMHRPRPHALPYAPNMHVCYCSVGQGHACHLASIRLQQWHISDAAGAGRDAPQEPSLPP